MKQEYKQKLLAAYDIICHNLRNINDIRPKLFFSYRQYNIYRETFPDDVIFYEKEIPIGNCSPIARAIYINPRVRADHDNLKQGYSEYLYTLIHELIHYYFCWELPEHDVKFEQKIGEIFKMIPEDEVYDELPPWPRVTNETMYMLFPKCMCLFKCWVEEDKSMYYKKDVGYPCDYCVNPNNFLKPVIAAAPKHF